MHETGGQSLRRALFWHIKFSINESYESVAILRQHLEQHGQHPRAMWAAVVTCSDNLNTTFQINPPHQESKVLPWLVTQPLLQTLLVTRPLVLSPRLCEILVRL